MINYFWIGLIVIAVVFAIYMDVTGQPPYEIPEPVVLEDFEGEVAWKTLSGEDEATFTRLVGPSPPGEDSSDRGGHCGRLLYFFQNSKQATILIGAPIEAAQQPPEALRMRIYGDASGNMLEVEFSDADGETFVARMSGRIDWREEWKTAAIPLDHLVPTASHPAAVVDFPLRLERLSIVRSMASPEPGGMLYFDQVEAVYPRILRTKPELESTSWMGVITKSSARWAGIAITLAIELIGIMMLWLGLMRIAEQAGLVKVVARWMKPVMRRLFPDIPPEGEAMGAILMNIAANMLGLGNAATPIGLKAMEELQKLNKNKEYASNAMCMLLAVNTSSVELIPAAIIGYRVAAGSNDIMLFWPLMVGTTVTSTIVAVLACKILEKLPVFKVPPPRMQAEPLGEEARS